MIPWWCERTIPLTPALRHFSASLVLNTPFTTKGTLEACTKSFSSSVDFGFIGRPITLSYPPLPLKAWSMSIPTAKHPAFTACSIFLKTSLLSACGLMILIVAAPVETIFSSSSSLPIPTQWTAFDLAAASA